MGIVSTKERSALRAVAVFGQLQDMAPHHPALSHLRKKGLTLDEMVSLQFDPTLHYDDINIVRWGCLLSAFLKKFSDFKLSVDPRAEAVKRFRLAEEMCRESNYRLSHRSLRGPTADRILWSAGKIATTILGSTPPSLKLPGWGPGATSSCKGKWLGLNNKLRARPEATAACDRWFGGAYEGLLPKFYASLASNSPQPRDCKVLDIVPGNTVTFVAKTAKTDRSIAVEPHYNAMLQRCVGQFIRDRLSATGLKLSTQADVQRCMARRGSIDGSVATIDLSMASDTVSRGIVGLMLPENWVNLLDSLRSPYYSMDGRWFPYYKHSSMGNGYTFELETLIFYSIACAVCDDIGVPRDVGVFGDDIAVPSAASELLLEVLGVAGFKANLDKTFTHGPFRESCGKDYYRGFDVRPFYARSLSNDSDLAELHNRAIEWFGCEEWARPLLDLIEGMMTRVSYVPIGRPGGVWTSNPLLVRTKFCRRSQELLYLGLVWESLERPPSDCEIQMEYALAEMDLRRHRWFTPSGDPLRVDLLPDRRTANRANRARGCGKWRRKWIPLLERNPVGIILIP